MSAALLNLALLRPAIIQILRASGFHAARPSVVEALTDITARYITLLASRAVFHAISNHSDAVPDVTDIRMALTDCGLLTPGLTATEEVWKELLRSPLSDLPERNSQREMEEAKRDKDDVEDIEEFIKWFDGPINKQIKRIAGLLPDAKQTLSSDVTTEDYLTCMMYRVTFVSTILIYHSIEEKTQQNRPRIKISRHHPGHRFRI